MKNKLMRKFLATVGILACSLCLVGAPTAILPVEAAEATEEGINPNSYTYEWIYREIDGKRYKRLYNVSTAEWVGEWIYIGEA